MTKNFKALELAIVHHLYTRRRGRPNLIKEDATKPCQNIVGWDANTLYLSAAVQQQPCVGDAQKSAKVKKYINQKTKFIKLKKDMKSLFLSVYT